MMRIASKVWKACGRAVSVAHRAPALAAAIRYSAFILIFAGLASAGHAQLADIVLDCETTTGIAPHTITINGAWNTSTSVGQPDRHGLTHLGDANSHGSGKWVRFQPMIPTAGWYRVYLWTPADPSYASNPQVEIQSADGIKRPTVNLRQSGGKWRPVGTFRFDAGNTGYVMVRSARTDEATNPTNGTVVADAVRFQQVEPELVLDNGDPGVTQTPAASWTLSAVTTAGAIDVAAANGNFLHDGTTGANGSATRSIEYRPNIPVAGRYQVYLTWPASSVNSRNAHVDVYSATGAQPAEYSVDQRTPGYEGVYIGTFDFVAGSNTNGRVVISNRYDAAEGEVLGRVVADSVRFVRVPGSTASSEVVIDQSSAGAVATGTWVNEVSALPDRLGYSHDTDNNPGTKGTRNYLFTPTLSQTGYYSVYVWWPADTTNSSIVPIEVNTASGVVSAGSVNQRLNGGKWNFIGKWWFNSGATGNVRIKNDGANGFVVADGVAFVRGDDADEDGMADSWELANGLNPGNAADASADADGDGLSNLEEYRAGLNPNAAQTLSKNAGDSQRGPANAALPTAIQVKVSTGAAAAAGAPVTFSVESGGGQVSADGVQWSASVLLATNASGTAQVYWRLGVYGSTDNTVRARFGTTQSTVFSARSEDLVGRWRFEETSGTVATDSSGTGNNGVAGNPNRISPSPSIDGTRALQFDGGVSERYFQVQNTDNRLLPAATSQPFTLAMWFKIKPNGTTAPNLYTLATNESYLTSGFRFGVDHELNFPTQYFPGVPDKPRLAFWAGQSGGSFYVLQQTSLKTDVWYHVAIVYTGTGGSMYINGQLAATATGTIIANNNPITIGTGIGGGPRDFNGPIDDVRVYTKALTAAEVAAISNVDSDNDGLVDWWKLAYYPSTPASQIDWNADADGDGLTTSQEYANLSDPTDYYNGVVPTISILSGANQSVETGGFLAAPVVYEVRRPDGTVWANAPVKVTAPVSGRIASSVSGLYGSEMVVRTNASGQISVYVKAQSSPSSTQLLKAAAGERDAKTNVSTTAQVAVLDEWLMNESSGLTTASSRSANTGTLLGGVSRQTGADGNGLSFAGGTNRVEVAEASAARVNFGTDQSFSVAAWVKMAPNANGSGRIVSKGDFGWTPGYFLSVSHVSQGSVAFGVGNGIWGNGLLFATQERFDNDLWHHVVAVFDRTTQKASIFVDGVQRTLKKDTGTGGTVSTDQLSLDFNTVSNLNAGSTEGLVFGKYLDQAEAFVGRIDEVRFYGGALTPAAITAIHTSYDSDHDGLTNYEEINVYHTNPNNPNTDGDDLNDGEEVLAGRNPLQTPQQVSDANGTSSIVNLELFTPLE